MKNTFCKFPLRECTRKLSAVAMGREKADLVIRNAKLVTYARMKYSKVTT